MKELVSIITPVHNSESFISQCIQSVISQSYTKWEHILVDDASIDLSELEIRKYSDTDKRIKYYKLNTNLGAAEARNHGIKLASGRYIAFLDSDDVWHSDKLKKQLCFISRNNYSFIYSQYFEFEEDIHNPKHLIKSPEKVNFEQMLKNDYIGCLTVVYDTYTLGKNYMPPIRNREDWILWLRLLKKVDFAYGLQEPLAYYRVGNKSLSSNKIKLLKYNFNVYYKELNMSYIKSVMMMGNFLLHYFHYKIFFKKKISQIYPK